MKKILITEDNKTFADALSFYLQDENYETLWVPDGLRGFLRANLWQPDLILMDIDLGASTGFEVAKEIMDAHIPIIFMTASNSPEFVEEARKYDAFAFFHKPLDVPKLLKTIRNSLFSQHRHGFVLA